jgi:hypothetical protein
VVANAYRAWKALHLRLTRYGEPFQADLWRPAHSGAAGVTVHQPGKALAGFTLHTSGHARKACLIGMDGRVVHERGMPCSGLWDRSATVRRPRPDAQV